MSSDPNIEIIELRGTKRISFRGMENLQRSEEELRAWVDEYEEALIATDDAIEEFEGLARWWNIGKVVDDAVEDSEGRAELAKLTRHSGLNIDQYTLKRYQNFSRMFPEKDYNPDIAQSIYTELAVGQRLESGRNAYDRMEKAEGSPRVYEVRAWGKCLEADDFSISAIIHSVIEEGKTQTNEVNLQKIFEGTKWVTIMSGGDEDKVTLPRVRETLLGEEPADVRDMVFTYDQDANWRFNWKNSEKQTLYINTGHSDWREATEADEQLTTKNRSQLVANIVCDAVDE